MILSVLNQKGGVGKTTLAVHLATAFGAAGDRVLLVDADPQGSALAWAATRAAVAGFPVIGLPKPVLHRELPALARDYAHVVVDGPPRVYDVARSAIMASDVVLIPVQPSPYDVWACREIVELLGEAAAFKEFLKAVFVVNRKIVNTAIGRDVAEALAAYPLPVLAASVGQRVAFAESAGQGSTVLELDPQGAASREVRALADEVLGLVRVGEGR